MNVFERLREFIYRLLNKGNDELLKEHDMIIREINSFKISHRRKIMLDGERYFEGKHDILSKKRMAIGEGGELKEIHNLPNNKIIDNQYAKMVNQKKNYLLGQPIVFKTENKVYSELLNNTFNMRFMRTMKNIMEDALNEGIAWLFVGYDEIGQLKFTKIKGYELIPLWKDADHTELEGAIRFYPIVKYRRRQRHVVDKIEIYNKDGVYHFELADGRLIADKEKPHEPYITVQCGVNKVNMNWSKIPLIPFKYNNKEIPLIAKVKSLQDGINKILSTFQDHMEEDSRNTIMVLVNYDGENLGEFRKNLATYGAIKVRNSTNGSGDVRTLQVEVNAENYKSIVELFKKAIIENAMGYDAKDDRLNGQPNQMNIQSMYSDIDLDANDTETEFQAAFEQLLWFINCHYANIGLGDYEHEKVDVIFNRDMLMNEGEIIDNVNKSTDLSLETRLANHPWVDNVEDELERIKKQKQEEMNEYKNSFPSENSGGFFHKGGGGDVDEE